MQGAVKLACKPAVYTNDAEAVCVQNGGADVQYATKQGSLPDPTTTPRLPPLQQPLLPQHPLTLLHPTAPVGVPASPIAGLLQHCP